MIVFVSWSGTSARQVAEALRGWLRNVLQSSKPWMAEHDIHAGAFWGEEIRTKLAQAQFGIICVTAQNINAPWLNYEAGALAERLNGKVCPYLFGVRKNDLAPSPLSRLQAQECDQDGTFNVVAAINRQLADDAIPEEMLMESFEHAWPKLAKILRTIQAPVAPVRSIEEKVDEVLTLIQGQSRILAKAVPDSLIAGAGDASAVDSFAPDIQVRLDRRLSDEPAYGGWSVQVTRFGPVIQARFLEHNGSRIISKRFRMEGSSDPVEALANMFLSEIHATE